MIYNFIGQPHSGKTTLSQHLYSVLKASNPDRELTLLDGDLLRKILNNTKFDEESRRQNISQGYAIAQYLTKDGDRDVILAMISPYEDLREHLKLSTEVIEIYLHTTNTRGRENFHVSNFQPPFLNYIDIDTTDVDELTSLNELLDKIEKFKK